MFQVKTKGGTTIKNTIMLGKDHLSHVLFISKGRLEVQLMLFKF